VLRVIDIEDLGQKMRVIQETTPWTNQTDYSSHRTGSAENLHKYDLPFNGTISPTNGSKKNQSSKAVLTRTLNSDHYKQPLSEQRYQKESFRSLEITGEGSGHNYPRSYSQERVSINSNPGNTTTSRGLSPSNKTGKSQMTSVSSKFSGIGMIDPNFLDVFFSF